MLDVGGLIDAVGVALTGEISWVDLRSGVRVVFGVDFFLDLGPCVEGVRWGLVDGR